MQQREIKLNNTQIIFGLSLLLNNQIITNSCKGSSSVVIITDSNVEPLYSNDLINHLESGGFDCHLLSVPAGEQSKSRSFKQELEDNMLDLGVGRDTTLIALGGGVVTDLGGFVASTYCRGIPLVLLPTSLLAMVDASIGGKTGVNVPQGKNLIGTFYQPKAIIMDIDLLSTLPEKEMRSGIVEMIKHGLILNSDLFTLLEKDGSKIFSNKEMLFESIVKSCQIKVAVVLQDEKEGGYRRIVNLGHTVAHAIEAIYEYATLNHGEAVAIGMVAEGYLANKLGLLKQEDLDRIIKILKSFEVLKPLDDSYDFYSLIKIMEMDKKAKDKKARFTLLRSIGEVESFSGQYCTEVSEGLIYESLEFVSRL